MSHQSLIDDALSRAKARMSSGVGSTDKIASIDGGTFLKEANETANALEYVALGMADDGSAAGAARSSMVQDYLKSAAAAGPSSGATTTTGTQSQVPSGSKKNLLMTPAGKVNPENSESLEGKQPENILRTMPPAVKAAPKDGGGKTANMSLYDVLMNNKEAAGGGPLEMDSDQELPGVPNGGDGHGFAASLLSSNSAPVTATKREAKAPTRPRLGEVWAHANDTTGAASGKAVWPQATSKGSLKVAELVQAFREEREANEKVAKKSEPGFLDKARAGHGRERAALLGATPFGSITSGAVGAKKGKGLRTSAGALAGRIIGGSFGQFPGAVAGIGRNSRDPRLGAFGAQIVGAMAGKAVGGATGAYLAHGEDKKAAAPQEDRFAGAKRVGKGALAGGALGAAAGGAIGVASGHGLQGAYRNMTLGQKKNFAQGIRPEARKGVKTVLRNAKKVYGGMGAAGLGAAGLGAGALAGGAYHMYKKRQAGQQQSKAAEAVTDYSELFDLALAGDLGGEYQEWAQGVEAL